MGFGYEKLATPCVRTNHNSQSESIPIPIPTPTPMGTRSRRIANNWLQAAAKPNDEKYPNSKGRFTNRPYDALLMCRNSKS
jgi:hypothetical protein